MSRQIRANGRIVTLASPKRFVGLASDAAKVSDILARRKNGEPVKSIAASYGVTAVYIYDILKARGAGTRTLRRTEERKL